MEHAIPLRWAVDCRPKGRPDQRVTAMARSLSMVLPLSLASELTEQVHAEVQAALARVSLGPRCGSGSTERQSHRLRLQTLAGGDRRTHRLC
jgi:hypothetical protein